MVGGSISNSNNLPALNSSDVIEEIKKDTQTSVFNEGAYLDDGAFEDVPHEIGGRDAELRLELGGVAEITTHQEVSGLAHEDGAGRGVVGVQRPEVQIRQPLYLRPRLSNKQQ